MKRVQWIDIITIGFALLLAVAPASSQTNSAVLQVTVADPTGARIEDATIVLEDTGQAICREAATDSRGSFTFTNLSPRTYAVTVSKDGFQIPHRDYDCWSYSEPFSRVDIRHTFQLDVRGHT